MVVAIIMAATTYASNSNSNTPVMETDKAPNRMDPFTEVNVSIPARIRVVQGHEYGILAQTSTGVDATKLDYKVKDGILYISSTDVDMLSSSRRTPVITIITPASDARVSTGTQFLQTRTRR